MAAVGTVNTSASPTHPEDEVAAIPIPVRASPALGPVMPTVATGATGGGGTTGYPIIG